jgi:hypothetical protein
MTGENHLPTLIRTMSPSTGPEVYVFLSIPSGESIPSGIVPVMMFREAEGLTLVAPREQAEAAGLSGSFPSRMITLTVQSALEAIGFLAVITARLAQVGIAVNAVSAFHHDHLFVPVTRTDEALTILQALAAAPGV